MEKIKKKIIGPVGLILAVLIIAAAGWYVLQRLSGKSPINVMGSLREKGIITIGVSSNLVPLGYVDTDGNHVGFEVELAQQLGERILGENSVVLVDVTPKTRGAYIDQSNVDVLVASVNRSEANIARYNMTEPYLQDDILFLCSSNADIDLSSPGTVVGVISGSVAKGVLEAHIENNPDLKAQIVNVPSHPEALEALDSMEIDFYCNDRITLSDKLLKEGYKLTGPIVGTQNYAVTSRLREKDLAEAIDAAYAQMKTDGTLRELYKKYNLSPPRN